MGQDYEIRNAVIKSAVISIHEHGFLDAWIQLDYGVIQQAFGGFSLYSPKEAQRHNLKSNAGHFIYRVMEIAGASSWDKLAGKTIRVNSTPNRVLAIGHIIKNDWFDPEVDFSNSI